MWQLDNKGYQPSTPQEILETLEAEVLKEIPNFNEHFPAELRGNLLYEGATLLVYFEQLITMLFNGYAPSQANETLFAMFANDRNIRQKGAYYSEVDLKFTGEVGSVIPKGTQVTNQEGTVIFETYEQTFIGTTGEIVVVGFCDKKEIPPVGIGDLNKLVLSIKDLSVENTNVPSAPQEQESFQNFKERAQAMWRNPKLGSYEAIITAIKSIDGVENRSVGYRTLEIQDQGKTYNAIEVMVNGGDSLEIAKVLYLYGGLTTKAFLSDPSNSETQRTVSQNIIVNGNVHTYEFTRSKLLKLKIVVQCNLINIEVSPPAIEALTKEAMQNYINNLKVGDKVNKASLTETFINGLKLAGGGSEILNKYPTFTVADETDQSPIGFDGQDFLNIPFDNYLVLSSYNVSFG